jgi:putative flippase GtrA
VRAFARFCAVGAVGFAVDAGITLALTQAMHWPPLQARVVAFLIAASATWQLNRRFTFRSTAGAATWAPYVLLTSVGAGINVGTYLLWVWMAGQGARSVLTGVALGSIVALAFNFLASKAIFSSTDSGPRWRASSLAGERSSTSISLSPGFVLLLTAALLWPALYNGFPLVFSDTGTYLATFRERLVPIDRPVYYGLFVGPVARVFGLSALPVVQAFAVSYVAWLFYRWLAPAAPAKFGIVLVATVALFTPIAWLSSWLMPDFLGGLVILGTVLLLFAYPELRATQRLVLAAILLLALLSHTGNILLFAAFGACAAAAAALVNRKVELRPAGLLATLGVASVVLSMLPNVVGHGRWTINPGSQAFITARLVGDGLVQPFLARHCPVEPMLPLCDRQSELVGMSNNDFLWTGDPSLAQSSGAWSERADEFRRLNTRVVLANLGAVSLNAVRNTVELMVRSEVGNDPLDDNFRAFGSGMNVTRKVEEHFPKESGRFKESRQQAGLNLDLVNGVHFAWTWISYALLASMLVIAWRRGARLLVAVITLVFVALLLNALSHGALSGVYTRYQAKVTWLPTLAAFACYAALRWQSAAASVEKRRRGVFAGAVPQAPDR